MIARAVALVSFPFTPSSTSSSEPSSLQRLMVLFPELIQYSCSVSKSMERPGKHRFWCWRVTTCPASRVCCLWRSHTKRYSTSLTDRAFLVGEEDAAIAAVRVGHVDGVPVGPVEFPEGGRQRESATVRLDGRRESFDLFSAHHNFALLTNLSQ